MTDERSSQVKPWMDLLDDIESCLSLIEQIPSKDMLSKIELTLLKGILCMVNLLFVYFIFYLSTK